MSDLPAKEVLIARTRALAERILKNRSAASLESYNGPVLFEGDAAGEVFSQQFASGLLAVRTPVSDDPRFEMFFNQMMTQLAVAHPSPTRSEAAFCRSFSASPTTHSHPTTRARGCSERARLTTMLSRPRNQTDPTRRFETLWLPRSRARRPSSTGSRRGWGPAPRIFS